MRRIFMGLGVVALLSTAALGREVSERSAVVNRWAFGFAGPDKVRAAADRCEGRPIAAVTQHHDGKDIAAAFFSLGIYTPVHVDYSCAPTAPTVNR